MPPAAIAAPFDDTLKLSDADKRILSGVIREKYADLIRRLKDHKGLLERSLADKLRRGEESWITTQRQNLSQQVVDKVTSRQGPKLSALHAAYEAASNVQADAEAALAEAQGAYETRRDEVLPTATEREIFSEGDRYNLIIQGYLNNYHGYSMTGPIPVNSYDDIVSARDEFKPLADALEPLAREARKLLARKVMAAQIAEISHRDQYSGFQGRYQQVVDDYERMRQLADMLDEAVTELADLAADLDKAQAAASAAEKPLQAASKALDKFTTRTGVEVEDDGEFDVTGAMYLKLNSQATKDAEARADKIAAVIEQLHEDSRQFRQQLALSRLESADAERIVASIPTSIDDLL